MEKTTYSIEKNTMLENRALNYLACIYYDRQYLEWDQLEKIAIVLYQNANINPCKNRWSKRNRKSFEQMAKYLFEIVKIIKKYLQETSTKCLFIDENLHFTTLGEMDGLNHPSCYNNICELSRKMQNCIQDKSFIDEYIFSLRDKTFGQIQFLNQNHQIDEKIQEELVKNLKYLLMLSQNHPEDIFRQIKVIQDLLQKNKRLLNEKEQRETQEMLKREEFNRPKVERLNDFMNEDNIFKKAQNCMEKIFILLLQTNDPIEKQVLNQHMQELQFAFMSRNSELMNQLILENENILGSENSALQGKK